MHASRRAATLTTNAHVARMESAAPVPFRINERSDAIPVATLFGDEASGDVFAAVSALAARVGAPLSCESIPASLARVGTVGRIGVPAIALDLMVQQRVVISSTFGQDSLAPVSRLFRGLQRRADVLVDVRRRATLPRSAASFAGIVRDVTLFSHRTIDRVPVQTSPAAEVLAEQWARARRAAELAFSMASSEQRPILLVLPVGRGTQAQKYFTDALEREARVRRVPPVRTVKAGLLSALLSGSASERWLIVSVMPIDAVSAMADEAMGDTGPWPVISHAPDATFYDVPVAASSDPLAHLLVLVGLLQHGGRAELAQSLEQSVLLTEGARARMEEELGSPIAVPADAFMKGVLANWGRRAPSVASPGPRFALVTGVEVAGLRLRIESSLSPAGLRDAMSPALMAAGLEVASLRGSLVAPADGGPQYDVRVRGRLGEPALSDDAAVGLVRAIGGPLRCVAVEPWVPVRAPGDRARYRVARAR